MPGIAAVSHVGTGVVNLTVRDPGGVQKHAVLGQDTVHYRIEAAGRPGPFTIETRLLYQSVKPGFVYGLHADDVLRVFRYKQMYEAVPPLVETLASATASY